jgi:hypothetical protein
MQYSTAPATEPAALDPQPPPGADRALLDFLTPYEATLAGMAFGEGPQLGITDLETGVGVAEFKCLMWEDGGDHPRATHRAEAARRVLDVMATHPAEARAYARYHLWVRTLTAAERRALRAEQAARHRAEYLGRQPASEAQIRYCRSLGWAGVIESKSHASEIIDGFKRAGAA